MVHKNKTNLQLALFISKKLITSKENIDSYTRPIINISVTAIALGLAIMIAAVCIVNGFQSEIQNKIVGFGSHIQITSFDSQNSIEPKPIDKNQDFYSTITNIDGVKHIQQFAVKPGILKTKERIQGALFKGIGDDFDWSFLESKIIEGNTFKNSSSEYPIILSKVIADKLSLKAGDKILSVYMDEQGNELKRMFEISGIYSSGMGGNNFDSKVVFTKLNIIQKLNNWDENLISGFEVLINDFSDLYQLDEIIYSSEIGYNLSTTTIVDNYPDIFNWLGLLDYNVQFIIILMLVVAAINIISALLILILERTNMIGILKALGTPNRKIRMVFIFNALYLLIKGLIYGNLAGLLLCFLQYQFQLIPLNPESYYIEFVPVKFDWTMILYINVGTVLLSFLILLIPSFIISTISPVKSIKFG